MGALILDNGETFPLILNGYEGPGSIPCDSSSFTAKNVACIVQDEKSFSGVLLALEHLGFETACSESLEATFEVVAEDPEEWAFVIVRLDRPVNETRLESYVRLLRMMDTRIPVLILAGKGKRPEDADGPKLYGDCLVREPKSVSELSNAIQVAITANKNWGARFSDFRSDPLAKLPRRFR